MTGVLHLYALLDEPVADPPIGAFGEPLVQVDAGPVVAVAGALAEAPEDGRPQALAHAEVVAGLARRTDAVLPTRYGTRFASDDALRAAVGERAPSLAARLAAVRGCAEVGLAAVFAEDGQPPAASGREYMQRRLAGSRLVDRLVREVHRPLAERARDARLAESATPPRFGAAYLVPRDDEGFLEAVDRLAAGAPVPLVRTGPWPAYSFAGEGAA